MRVTRVLHKAGRHVHGAGIDEGRGEHEGEAYGERASALPKGEDARAAHRRSSRPVKAISVASPRLRPLESEAAVVCAWVVAERLTTCGLLGAVLVTVNVPVSEPEFVG
jgi:hypothetical protein